MTADPTLNSSNSSADSLSDREEDRRLSGFAGWMRRCSFPDVALKPMLAAMAAGTTPPEPDAGDAAALKVDKNVLAAVFVEPLWRVVDAWRARNPGCLALPEADPGDGSPPGDAVIPIPVDMFLRWIDPERLHGSVSAIIQAGMANVFIDCTHRWALAMEAAAAAGASDAETALYRRYRETLHRFQSGHTAVQHLAFTPEGHLMAGVKTAVFFTAAIASAACVLTAGRPGLDPVAVARNSVPLLITAARMHLDQLVSLTDRIGGSEAGAYGLNLTNAEHAALMAELFTLQDTPRGPALALRGAIADALPALANERPRTGCPALHAADAAGTNTILALNAWVLEVHAALLAGADAARR